MIFSIHSLRVRSDMLKDVKVFESSEGNVWKYVFILNDAVAEAVLYRYGSFEERTVICVSVQSGCPVGCTFCGTGKTFIRNLTPDEIMAQVNYILKDKDIHGEKVEKFQIMFMSMGEPFLNYSCVASVLMKGFNDPQFENVQLLISTIAPYRVPQMKHFIELCKNDPRIGLQFSIHESTDVARDILIPYKSKLNLNEIRNYGIEWWKETGRKPYCNYCINGSNNSIKDAENLINRFPPTVFCFTFSVVCSADENMKETAYRNIEHINAFEKIFMQEGYDTRIFDPAVKMILEVGADNCGMCSNISRS